MKVIGEARPHDIKIIVSLEASNRVSTCKEINALLIKEIEQPLCTKADSVRKLQFRARTNHEAIIIVIFALGKRDLTASAKAASATVTPSATGIRP